MCCKCLPSSEFTVSMSGSHATCWLACICLWQQSAQLFQDIHGRAVEEAGSSVIRKLQQLALQCGLICHSQARNCVFWNVEGCQFAWPICHGSCSTAQQDVSQQSSGTGSLLMRLHAAGKTLEAAPLQKRACLSARQAVVPGVLLVTSLNAAPADLAEGGPCPFPVLPPDLSVRSKTLARQKKCPGSTFMQHYQVPSVEYSSYINHVISLGLAEDYIAQLHASCSPNSPSSLRAAIDQAADTCLEW